jgi:anti-sigma factor RsiW
MPTDFSNSDLEAYLDESLPAERMAAIEEALRHSDALQRQVAAINGRRDAGVHSLGEIWRRHRLSCPSREQLGSYLLGVLPRDASGYVKFHLETIQCRYCAASVADLQAQRSVTEAEVAERRRQKYFQSSAGYLRKK